MPSRRKSAPEFNPQSLDATLATILAEMKAGHNIICARMDGQDVELKAIKEQALKTNGRVGILELWRATSTAKQAGFAAAFGMVGTGIAWGIGVLFKK